MSTTIAAVLLLGVVAYAVFAGADFGAGIWDLIAGGTKAGRRPRDVIDHAIAPVWEANHVWLIFIFVVLWTSFPTAYASITLTLFVPLTIAAVGIVLRGSGFAFRKTMFRDRDRRPFGAAFAISSLMVPYCFGAIAGAIATGRVPEGGRAGDPVDSWVNPTSVLGGVLAVVTVSYLAATYLTFDARRLGDDEMVEYFRRRGQVAAVVAGVVAMAGIVVLREDADYLYDGLTSRALPVVIASTLCGAASLLLLHRGSASWARVAAAGAVAGIVAAWGVAQWPYVIPTSMKIADTAAPSSTLAAVLVAFGLACLIVLPALALLYRLDQKGLLPEEGVDD